MSTVAGAELTGVEKLQRELTEVWRGLPNKGLFFALLLPWVLLFQFLGNSTFGYLKSDSLFEWMYFVFSTSPDDGHCMLIPFVVVGLAWWKREELMAVPKSDWYPGIALVLLGLVLHVGGYMSQQSRISIVGFFVGLYGLIGIAWGWRFLKASFFPYFLFVFCVPLGTMADSRPLFMLRILVSYLAAGFSNHVLGIEVVRDGTQLFDPGHKFEYEVAAACSGMRSLTVLLALTTIYGFVTFQSTWRRLLMVGLSVPVAVLGNTLRIIGVVFAAEAFGQEAGMKFHDNAGFLVFVVAVLSMVGMSYLLRENRK